MPGSILNRIQVVLFQIPWVKNYWARHFKLSESESIPWTPLAKPLAKCRIAIVTTGGVHLKTEEPFNMQDKDGDPTFRLIPSSAENEDLVITHDYYDHKDADEDINLIFPIGALVEAQRQGLVGDSAEHFYGLMGHIDKHHVDTLINKTAPAIADRLMKEGVDVVLLIPA